MLHIASMFSFRSTEALEPSTRGKLQQSPSSAAIVGLHRSAIFPNSGERSSARDYIIYLLRSCGLLVEPFAKLRRLANVTADEVNVSDGPAFGEGDGILDATIDEAELQALLGGSGGLGGRKPIY